MTKFSKQLNFLITPLAGIALIFSLSPRLEAEPKVLGDLVVTGTLSEHDSWHSPISTQSIRVADETSALNVADLLARQGGVELLPGIRGYTLRLQGLDGKYVLILIDGQRVSGKVNDTLDLSALALNQIESIEIIRGASSALYGSDAIGGVINIIRKKSGLPSHKAQVAYGSDKRVDLSGHWQGRSSPQISARIAGREALKRSGSEATRFSGTEEAQVGVSHSLDLRKDLELRAQASYEQLQIEGTDVSGAGAIWDRKNASNRFHLGLSPTLMLSEETKLHLNSQLQVYRDLYKTHMRRRADQRTREVTNERLQQHTLNFQHALGLENLLTLGIEHLNESLSSDRLEKSLVQRQRSSLYAQDEYSFSETLMLVPGFRLDHDSQFETQSTGKLALRYAWADDTLIRPSYGQGYRAPSFKELYLLFENGSAGYSVEGNTNLKPESSEQWLLAVDHRLTAQHHISLSIFHNAIKDMILSVEEPSEGTRRFTYQNLAEVETRGLDSSFEMSLWSAQLTLCYQYLEAQDKELKRQLEARSNHSFSYRLARLKLGQKIFLGHDGRIAGAQTLYDTEGRPQRSVATYYANADLNYIHDPDFSSSFGVENLSNSSENRVLEVRPRTYVFKFTWNNALNSKEP